MGKLIYPYGANFFVLPRAEIGGGNHSMVKDADFFYEQNGHKEPWGETWIPVKADGLNHARLLAWFIGSNTQFPTGCAFSLPNYRTVKSINHGGFAWGRTYA